MIVARELCAVSMRESPVEGSEDSKRAFISAVISSGKVDGHGTWMNDRTLENFAQDLNDSIQFKDSHRRGQGFGVSESGVFADGVVTGDFKLIRGWPLADASYPSSDIFIDAIEEGVITRVSVGFSGGRHICGICKAEWYRSNCWHWPGKMYEVVGEGGKSEMVECLVEIDDARLSEVSAVSRGSNPDAEIVEKAERCLREGKLPEDVRRELVDIYDMRLEGGIVVPGVSFGGSKMSVEQLEARVSELETERDGLQSKVAELEPLAECGRGAREHMAGEALDAFKVSRGESVSESDIKAFTERAGTLSFAQLVTERDYLRGLAPSKPAVEPGSSTTQPDNSGNRGEGSGDEKRVRGVNPSHWGVR